MALFSSEFLLSIGWTIEPDFSYKEEARKNIGEVVYLVCEGFGSVAVQHISDNCYLFFPNQSAPVLLEDVISQSLNSNKCLN